MDPLTNAVLGLVFLGVGTVATVAMYYLRGRQLVGPTEAATRAAQPSSALPASHKISATGRSSVPKSGRRSSDPSARTDSRWYRVAGLDELADGAVAALDAGTRTIALTRQGGEYGAIDGVCPHQGGPLADGPFQGGVLRCPWHGWGFDSRTGKSLDPNHGDVSSYEVDIRDDGVYVRVDESIDTTPTVSDMMVETMIRWGVRHVFGMVGHSNLGLAEAVRKQEERGDLTFFGTRHEGAASFACSAYAKLTGRPAACLTIAGPGATNLLTGLWDAHVDRAPVLALTGQVNTQVLGPGAFQEIDQASAFQAVATWSQTVLTTSDHCELMTLALKHAVVERGVAHLIFPDEVQVLPVADAEPSDAQGRLGEIGITPDPRSIEEALGLIARAKRPTIIVGYGARECMDQVMALAEAIGAPVLTTFKGKGQLSDQHSLAAGVLGRSGTPIAGGLMSQADLLIVFGASFAAHTGIDRSKPIIQVDFDQLALGKFHPVAVPVWGEIGITADLLRRQLPSDLAAVDIREELAERWRAWRAEKAKRSTVDRGQGINSAAVFASLSRLAPENAVIAVDVGNNTYSFGRYFECKNQAVLMSGYLGSIGFGFPAAIGAWAAAPDRMILSVSGDGGFGQYMGEFTTAVKYKMNITHILLNNHELGKISKEQKAGNWPVWQTSLVNPNFADFATLCGGYGVRVERIEQLDKAIADAMAYEGPALVEVISDVELT